MGAWPSTGDETRFGSDRPARRADRRRPHDEADEATVGSPRATGVAPTATTRAFCSTGRDPMSTVSVDVDAW